MVSPVIDKLNRANMKDEVPTFSVGDNVSVHCTIHEGGKERTQVYTGTVIARDGTGATETFTVRRVTHGVAVERIFPVHSPYVTKIDVIRSSHVRRAKLYYLRKRSGKQTRLREKIRK